MSVAKGAGNTFEDSHNLVDADRKELNEAYVFEAQTTNPHVYAYRKSSDSYNKEKIF